MNNKNIIPEWLNLEEEYIPLEDKDSFIDKSTLAIMSVLSKIKTRNNYDEQHPENASLRLMFNLLLIILVSISKNNLFVTIIIAGVLLKLCFLNDNMLLKILKTESVALIFSALILMPSAVFMKNLNNCIFIIMKVFTSTTLMLIFSFTTQWNTLSASLKKFKVPDICIFIFDITLKYIVLLGRLCMDMLTALKLRSIGRNDKKQKSLSAIAGTTFIKSTEMAEEMYYAMECRGFTGEYKIQEKKASRSILLAYILSAILIIILFVYME